MISSDKNVESIGQLINELKEYFLLQKEFVQLDIIDKVVRITTALIVGIVVFILSLLVLFYLSFAVVHWLEPLVGTAWAFAIISAFFLLLLVLAFVGSAISAMPLTKLRPYALDRSAATAIHPRG